jgi:hypothetical protein
MNDEALTLLLLDKLERLIEVLEKTELEKQLEKHNELFQFYLKQAYGYSEPKRHKRG